MKFWDSSAIVPLCIHEKHTSSVKQLLSKDHAVVVWWGTEIECVSAFARQKREGNLKEKEEGQAIKVLQILASLWTEVCATDEVKKEAKRLLRLHSLRTADSLQLAAAIVWANCRPNAHPFVTFDENLRISAEKEGFLLLP